MRTRLLAPALLLFGAAACSERSVERPFSHRGVSPGMSATDLRAAATIAGIGSMECRPLAVVGLAADLLCYTPDSSASMVSLSAMVNSQDSVVPYVVVREGLTAGLSLERLEENWGTPTDRLGTARRWVRGRWTASADTAASILTVWLSDTATARLVALASAAERFAAPGADTLPVINDATAVLDSLLADSAGGPPVPAADLDAAPSMLGCTRVPPPDNLAGRAGAVSLAYVVDSAGRVETGNIRVLEATHGGLIAPAIATVRSCTLQPGTRDGRPVRTLVQQRVSFAPTTK
jgi:hypothetical protein